MSSAMEQMVAKMLGFTPQELHNTLQGFRDMIVSTSETLARIETKIDAAEKAADYRHQCVMDAFAKLENRKAVENVDPATRSDSGYNRGPGDGRDNDDNLSGRSVAGVANGTGDAI